MDKVILQLVPSLESGGVERGTIDIAIAIKQKGWTPIVASSGGFLVKKLEENGIQHINLNFGKTPQILRSYFLLKKICKEHNVNIIHARSRIPAWLGYFIPNVKFITTFHGFYNHSFFLKRLYNSIMSKGLVVIAVSEFIKKHIHKVYKIPNSKIRVIHRGVDLKEFEDCKNIRESLNLDKNTKIILLPGRFSKSKGHLMLIEALKYFPMQYHCLMVGKFDKKYTALIKRNAIPKSNFSILDSVSNIKDYYYSSDVVVCPSIRPEAFGRVVTEAQAVGGIVVATNIGGVTETVKDGVNGFTCEKDARSLRSAMLRALSLTSSERNVIAKNARKSIEDNFTLESMIEKTIEIYSKIL